MNGKVLLLITLALASTMAYDYKEEVLLLTADNFDQANKDFNHILVKFFAPWCGHCKSLAPAYAAAAGELKAENHAVVLAEVDCTQHQSLCSKHGIKGYPTLKMFSGDDGAKITDYKSGRTKDALLQWAREQGVRTDL